MLGVRGQDAYSPLAVLRTEAFCPCTLTTLAGEFGRKSRAHVDLHFPLSVASLPTGSSLFLSASYSSGLVSRAIWAWTGDQHQQEGHIYPRVSPD